MLHPDTYTIPYLDKYIIYQPLNKFAFVGNQATVDLIGDVMGKKIVNPEKNKKVLSFLQAHGFFNTRHFESSKNTTTEFKPTVAVLCMTSACNFRCTYCFANGGDAVPSELSLDTGKKAIDFVYDHAVKAGTGQFTVAFHGGGEPALPFQKLQDFTRYARNKDLPCSIELTSNGYWNNNKAAWIISNIDTLTLSFDGIKEVQDQQRPLTIGGSTFDVIMNNIRKLDQSGIRYGIRLTVTNNSVNHLERSIAFLCNETKCQTFQVEPAFGAGRAVANHQTIQNNKLFVESFLKAYDIARENKRWLYYSGARPWVNTDCFCTAHDNALVVTPDGILSSCYEISGGSHPLAEAFHFGQLSATGEMRIDFKKREDFQNRIAERKLLCRECYCYWHCAGDCPAKTILPGSFGNTTFSSRCDVNRDITRELLIRCMIDSGGVCDGKSINYKIHENPQKEIR
jgi:uncharacterized protein